MTKADICNVRLVHTDDLKELQDSLNEAVSAEIEAACREIRKTWDVERLSSRLPPLLPELMIA